MGKLSECKLCKKEKELRVSHIVPRAIFRSIYRDNSGKGVEVTGDENTPNQPTQRQNTERLLCHSCEQLFSKSYENSGLKYLRGQLGSKDRNGLYGVDLGNIELMIISIFWRASVSSIPAYSGVSFDEVLNERIREDLLKNYKRKNTNVSVKIHSLKDSLGVFSQDNLEKIHLSISRKSYRSGFCYSLVILGYLIEFFVPGLNYEERKKGNVLSRNRNNIYLSCVDIWDVPDLGSMLKIAHCKGRLGLDKT